MGYVDVTEDSLRLSRNGSRFCTWIHGKLVSFVKESACE